MTEVTAAVAQGLGPPRRQFSGVHGVEGSLGGCSGARQGQSLCGWTYSAGQGAVYAAADRGVTGSSPPPRAPSPRGWGAAAGRAGVGSARRACPDHMWAGCHAEPACHGDLRTGHCKPAGANVPMRVRGGLAGAQPACTQPSTTEQRCAVTLGSRGPASRTAHRPVLEGTPPQALLSPPLSPAESVLPPRPASRSSRSVFSVGTASGR